MISGYNTFKIITETGDVRVTAWHSPELGCTPLLRKHEERLPGQEWRLLNTLEVTHISNSEPDSMVFANTGIEMSPGAARAMALRAAMAGSARSAEEVEAKVAKLRSRLLPQDDYYESHK